jgi:arsenate reductase-like glutaredoxin family protein
VIANCFDLLQPRQVEATLKELKGFWKLWSACLLQGVGLPTPRGIIVTRRYASLEADLRKLLQTIGATAALLRHDRQNEAPPYPRGGFLVPADKLVDGVQAFFSAGRIVAVYEPLHRLQNGYNLNLLFESEDKVLVEIAGPGFDASNLQRGDITPHEVLAIQVSRNGDVSRLKTVYQTTDEEFRRSARNRVEKFREFSTGANVVTDEALCSKLLQQRAYLPVPQPLIVDSVRALTRSRFLDRFRTETDVGFPINVSSSFVDDGRRQIFWDATAPSLKFEGLTRPHARIGTKLTSSL